jgi:hypothetical protein
VVVFDPCVLAKRYENLFLDSLPNARREVEQAV